jgi:hypothetical protein
MISNDKISTIIEDCKLVGCQVRVRDISFVILSKHFEDASVAYKAVFGSDANEGTIESYIASKEITYLKNYIESNGLVGGKKKGKKKFNEEDDITFDENKAEIIKLIKETQKALEEGKIKSADALKIQADLRVKLNDKFSVKDESQDSLVVVNMKYNAICSCGRELYIPTKEDLMQQYNLVENK